GGRRAGRPWSKKARRAEPGLPRRRAVRGARREVNRSQFTRGVQAPLRKSASKGDEVGGGGSTKRKGPAAVKPQALSPFRPRYSAAGDVHLQVGEVDLALLFERGGGLVDVLPAAVAAVVPAGVRPQVALAADAQRPVRQGGEAPHRASWL